MATATQTAPDNLSSQHKAAWLACAESPLYFIYLYCQVYDAVAKDWIPFHLWPAQASTLKTFQLQHLVVVLKARQIGLTWLAPNALAGAVLPASPM